MRYSGQVAWIGKCAPNNTFDPSQDLFLDTPLFNAHTTGGDILWAGVLVN